MTDEKKDKKENKDTVKIVPLKAWRIFQNDIDIKLEKDVSAEVPKKFVETLKTEEVI